MLLLRDKTYSGTYVLLYDSRSTNNTTFPSSDSWSPEGKFGFVTVRYKTDLDVCESGVEGTGEELSEFLTTSLHCCPLPSNTQDSRAQVSVSPIPFCGHLNCTFTLPLGMHALCPKMAHLGSLIPEGCGPLGIMECVCLCVCWGPPARRQVQWEDISRWKMLLQGRTFWR